MSEGPGKVPAVGIDFGTSKSCIAVHENGSPLVLGDFAGHRTLPSVVLVDPEDKMYVGWDAVNNPLRYQSRSFTINSVKRCLGTSGAERCCRIRRDARQRLDDAARRDD